MRNQTIRQTVAAQDEHLPLTGEIMSAALHVAGMSAGAARLGDDLAAVRRCLFAAADMARELESRATAERACAYYRHVFPVAVKFSYADSEETDTRLLFLSFLSLSKKSGGSPLVYLAAPYAHAEAGIRCFRTRYATACAAWLMAHGISVFSPLTHGHPISEKAHIGSYDGWAGVNERLLAACDAVLVLNTHATAGSRGVRREVELARELGIPVQLVTTLGPEQYGIGPLPASVWGWDGVPEACHARP